MSPFRAGVKTATISLSHYAIKSLLIEPLLIDRTAAGDISPLS